MRPLPRLGVLAWVTLAILLAACNSATGPRPLGEGMRILFIGNSHTYLNDALLLQEAAAEVALTPTPDTPPIAQPVITSRC